GHEARRLLRQRLARQPRRRGGPGARPRLGPAGRVRDRRRPRGGADAQSRHRGPPRRHRDAAPRRAHAAGDRAPGVRHGRAGRRDRAGPCAQRRGERAACDAARALRKEVSKERSMKKILITGAAGDVGSHLRRELAGRYALRLSDIRPIKDLAKGEEFIRGDCANLRDMLRVTKGVDAVVHLGGFSVEGSWEVILRANIVGTYNAFEAARRNGARRTISRSSCRSRSIAPESASRSCTESPATSAAGTTTRTPSGSATVRWTTASPTRRRSSGTRSPARTRAPSSTRGEPSSSPKRAAIRRVRR